jgi:PAS domain S-box-containing protein
MDDQEDEISRIRKILQENPKGITIEEISKKLPLNRTSTAKYLNTLQISGQAEMRTFGRAKVFTLSQRVPFSQMLNLSSDLLLVFDQNLRIMQVNEPFVKVFGIASDILIGTPIEHSVLLPELSEKYLSLIKESLAGTEHITLDQFQIQGQEFFFKIKLIPIVFDQGGQGLALILEDITELKKYQQHLEQQVYDRTKELIRANEQLQREIDEHQKSQIALEQSERKYRELVENANSIILRVNDQGIITFFNEFAQTFFGVSESEMLGKNIFGTIIPINHDSTNDREKSLRSFLKPTEHLTFNEIECLHGSGEPAWVAWTNKAIYDPSGKFAEHLIVGMDITERKQVENALHQVNANLNLVSSIARHDILNKITVINGSLFLLKNTISDENLLKYVINCETAMYAIKRQIEFTRDYKDMGMEKADWHDLEQTINEAVENLDLREIQVILHLNGLEIFADPWLTRVFINLLDSMLHKGRKTKIIQTFYSESDEGLDLFLKCDNGGIPPEEKERLFERGYGENDGFGLFIAREILAITGISIREIGTPELETQFEIKVPKRAYRYSKENLSKI